MLFRRLAEPAEFLKDFRAFFSRCQDELVTPDDYQRYVDVLRRKHDARKKAFEPDALAIAEEEVATPGRTGARLPRRASGCCASEICTRSARSFCKQSRLLRTDAELLARMREQYRYILVDEFQDTNIAQLELLWLLAGERRNILAVGDDDQAIYRFRGASFGSFTIFLERFCGVARRDFAAAAAKKALVSLSQNYRSTKRILRVAGEMISHNEKSPLLPPKNLTTGNPDGEKIRVVEFAAFEEEAQWVAAEIERLHEAGASWRSFAVLYRKHTHRAQLLDALRRTRNSVRDPQVFDSVEHAGARPAGVDAPDRGAGGQRGLRAGARGALLGARAARSGAAGRARGQKSPAAALGRSGSRRIGSRRSTARACGLPELVQMLEQLRQSARNKTATEMLDELIASLGLAPLPSDADAQYLERLVEFVKEWERKSERQAAARFHRIPRLFRRTGWRRPNRGRACRATPCN